MRAVVDASVAVALFVDQPLSETAAAALAEYDFAAPTLILAEIGNAFWKYSRANRMPEEKLAAARERLEKGMIACSELTPAAAWSALRLAVDLDHPIYDCFYLALSKELRAPLITADRRLAGAAARAGVDLVDLDVLEGQTP